VDALRDLGALGRTELLELSLKLPQPLGGDVLGLIQIVHCGLLVGSRVTGARARKIKALKA
jgi:hypothetical protein